MALKVGNKIYLSWDDISILVEDLCDTIASSGVQITSITGIKRAWEGGI